MKLSDYIVQFLAEQGVKHVFGLTGGAVVHFFDSIDRHPKMEAVFNHHEQAAAFAAQAYARTSEGIGAAIVTTGPGGTNALTGLCAAWLDSIPCIYISGQARLAHTTRGKAIRQLGTQQLDIISIVSHMTKYSILVDAVEKIKYYLQKAVYMAKTGRPGPVWVDIPLDFQWASVDPDQLVEFHPSEIEEGNPQKPLADQVAQSLKVLAQARRPLILAGYGIRLANAQREFEQFIKLFKIPFLSTWNASDLLPTNHELYVGRPGMFGQRGANLAIQNCDVLLSIGSHLCIPITGSMLDAFAREAKIIMVDVDQVELDYRARIDIPIATDAKAFIKEILQQAGSVSLSQISSWRQKCLEYKSKYNEVLPQCRSQKKWVNPYYFIDILSEELNQRDIIVVDGGGTVNQITFQAFRVKMGQRLMISAGLCAMGSGLPDSVGACLGAGRRRTICLCGDGSMQLNIQELQTIIHHKLPIKIFVFNNDGYLSIRHTQQGFLEENYVGSAKEGGLSLPDILKVAKAYGMKTCRIRSHKEMTQKIRSVLNVSGPAVCEIMISPKEEVLPRPGFDKRSDGTFRPRPLEDMYPFLERKEFMRNMLVEQWDKTK